MIFVDRLSPELISVAAPWHSLAATTRGLVDLLARSSALPPAAVEGAVAAVLAREADASTALLDVGAGVPHARLDGLSQTAVALAIAPAGLYEVVPTVYISIVALVLSPATALDGHLHMLASIATSLRSPGLRAGLLAASDASEAYAVLCRHAVDGA